MRAIVRSVVVVALVGLMPLVFSTGASADSTPYELTEQGIKLNNRVFADNGHVNVRLSDGRTMNAHFESKCVDASAKKNPECFSGNGPNKAATAQFIGESLVSWSSLGIVLSADECVSWVQVDGENYHYGENGEAPFCGKGKIVDGPKPAPVTPHTPTKKPHSEPSAQEPGKPTEDSNPHVDVPVVEEPTEQAAPAKVTPQPANSPAVHNPASEDAQPAAQNESVDAPLTQPHSTPKVTDAPQADQLNDTVTEGPLNQGLDGDVVLVVDVKTPASGELTELQSWREIESTVAVVDDVIEVEELAQTGSSERLAQTGMNPALLGAVGAAFLLVVGGIAAYAVTRESRKA